MEKPNPKLHQILERHVPTAAVQYCHDLWRRQPFSFKVTRRRQSKLGDYRFEPAARLHTISVNNDLNNYAFLITYLHEYAHLLTNVRHGRKTAPHGPQWKAVFKEVMHPVLSPEVFPANILAPLRKHMQNPPASTYRDHTLLKALRSFDPVGDDEIMLDELEEGSIFALQGNLYKKLQTRRTRVLCQRADASRRYLISKSAMVTPMSNNRTKTS